MAAKFCLKALGICLLFALVTGLDVEKQSLSDWEGELGVDMCPECRSCPPQDPSTGHSLSKQKEAVANGVPQCEGPLPEPMSSGYNLHSEEKMGMDRNPESIPRPALVPTVDRSKVELQEYGCDMCPECRCLPLPETMSSGYNLHSEEKMGMDRNPESIPRPALVSTVDRSKVELQEYGCDMCPECRCLLGEPRSTSYSSSREGLEVDLCSEKEL